MKLLLKNNPDEKIAYLTTEKYLAHQAEKYFMALGPNTVKVRTYEDAPLENDYILICDEWIEASLKQLVTFNDTTEWFTGVHGLQKRCKKLFIFDSYVDESVEKLLRVLHPEGLKVIDIKSMATALGLSPMNIQNVHVH